EVSSKNTANTNKLLLTMLVANDNQDKNRNTSTLLEAKEIEFSPEENGQLVQSPSNQLMILSQKTSQNEVLNLEQLNEDNDKASNITINGEDTTGETKTKKMSYSEAVGHHQRKRTNRVIECTVDNGWAEEVKRDCHRGADNHTTATMDAARELRKIYDFYRLPKSWLNIKLQNQRTVGTDTKEKILDNIDLIQEQIIQTAESRNEFILPITDYKKVNKTIKILKETFEFNNIPTHLLQLSKLEKPNWDLFKYDYYDLD
ncbi:35566_t:CDS:2, partial [Gigaspora margarita]